MHAKKTRITTRKITTLQQPVSQTCSKTKKWLYKAKEEIHEIKYSYVLRKTLRSCLRYQRDSGTATTTPIQLLSPLTASLRSNLRVINRLSRTKKPTNSSRTGNRYRILKTELQIKTSLVSSTPKSNTTALLMQRRRNTWENEKLCLSPLPTAAQTRAWTRRTGLTLIE